MLKRYFASDQFEAGCDEAGRGCLAGPVVAAAVILPAGYANPLLDDSKKLTGKSRSEMRKEIENLAVSFAVSFIDNIQIDEINILKASILGMHDALSKLSISPDHILVDGNHFFRYRDIPHTCVVKGDGTYLAIAAASVLAKTYRDEYMISLHRQHQMYGWDKNKGYPTQYHREAILKHGLSEFHRRSFQLTNTQMEISFSGTK